MTESPRDDPEEIRARIAALTPRAPQPAEPTVRDDLARNVAQLWRRDRAAADGQPMLVGRTYQGELWTALNQLAAAYVDAGAPQPAVPDGPRLDELHRALARRIGNLRKGSRKLLEISSARNAKHVALLDERDRLRDELDEARRIGADVARQRAELLRQNERSAPAVPDGEDATAVCPICGRTAALVLDAHGHFGPDVEAEDEVVCDVSHWRLSWAAEKAAGGRPDTRSSLPVVDGEDVPARLEAAADACEALGWTGTANTFRDLASQLREWDEETPDVRAAVAAALARPTGHQQ